MVGRLHGWMGEWCLQNACEGEFDCGGWDVRQAPLRHATAAVLLDLRCGDTFWEGRGDISYNERASL